MIDTQTRALPNPQAIGELIADLGRESKSCWAAQYIIRLAKQEQTRKAGTSWDVFSELMRSLPSRSVDCRLLLPDPHAAGSMGALDAASRLSLEASGWQVRVLRPQILVHAKAWAFGSGVVWAGSQNLTAASWAKNQELSIRTTSEQAQADIRQWYLALWHSASTP